MIPPSTTLSRSSVCVPRIRGDDPGLDDDEVRNVESEIRRNVTKAAASALISGVVAASGGEEPGEPIQEQSDDLAG